MTLQEELKQMKEQQDNAKALWTKLQGIIEYLEGKIAQEAETPKDNIKKEKSKK